MTGLAIEYAGFNASGLEEWQGFAEDVLGVAADPGPGGTLRLRIDERAFRLAIHEDGGDGALAYVGWRCVDPVSLDSRAEEFRGRGVDVVALSTADAEMRGVRRGFAVTDPDGYRMEFIWGSDHRLDVRALGGRALSPATLWLGHVVIGVSDIERSLDFYLSAGMRLTDLYESRIAFLHCDRRHHSLALVGTEDLGVRHIMLEAGSMADLGILYDRAVVGGWATRGLGQHVNDEAVTFYCRTPSESSMELAWGSRVIDPSTWTPRLLEGPMSYWGHPHL